MEKERLHWIDWAKSLGILLVIIAHMPTQYGIGGMIYAFHMPLFIVISGFLYKPISFKQELIRSFYCLIIPYLIYNAILIMLGFIAGPSMSLHVPFPEIRYVFTGQQELLPLELRIMWFIISVFLLRCIFAAIQKYKHTKIQT
jgi:fucose 4-O-acetylase-like acetyltransferase